MSGSSVQQPIDIEALCAERGLRITEQRRIIARVLSNSSDHPDVEKLHQRAVAIDAGISIATVYRTVRLFEEAGILDRHDFGDGRSRYEAAPEAHHDHMIDVESGKVIEFVDPELEALQRQISERLGFRLVDHRMELYGVKLDRNRRRDPGICLAADWSAHSRNGGAVDRLRSALLRMPTSLPPQSLAPPVPWGACAYRRGIDQGFRRPPRQRRIFAG
jgi:Fur family ferric uptake transcriptional regulator